MLRLAFVCSAMVIVGCDGVFGLIEIEPPEIQPPGSASLTMERYSLGTTVVRQPFDVTGYSATYLIVAPDDPGRRSRVTAEQIGLDTWRAELPAVVEGSVAVAFTRPNGIPRHLELPGRDAKAMIVVLEHPNPEPVPAGAMFTVDVSLPAIPQLGETFSIDSIGSWSTTALAIPTVAQIGPLTIAPTDLRHKITTADSVFVFRRANDTQGGNKLTGIFEATPFDQTGSDTIAGAMAALPADQTFNYTTPAMATLTARFAAIRPAVANPFFMWTLTAAPAARELFDNGVVLAHGRPPTAPTGTQTVTYANPLTRWPTLFVWQARHHRLFAPGLELYAGLQHWVEALPGTTPLDLPAGMPITISIDRLPLVSDGINVPIDRDRAVEVSFICDRTDDPVYTLHLYELFINTAGDLERKQTYLTIGVESRFRIPGELFEHGKRYLFRAICERGFHTAAADSDLSQRSLPGAVGFLDGGVFTVVAP